MRVTVVTVAYNAAPTISDTVRSVAAQRGVDVEHLIIDGGSTDGTLPLLAGLGAPNLRVISDPDHGLYDAMNKGLKLAQGDVVGFLNADDFFCRIDALQLIAASISASGCDAVSASIAIVDTHNADKIVRSYGSMGFRPWMFHFAHMPPHPGFYVRTEAARTVGELNTNYQIAADFDWLARFYLEHRFSVEAIPQTLVAMRSGGVSQRGLKSMRKLNSEAALSLAALGRPMPQPLMWLKYAAKSQQFLRHNTDYPSPANVAWSPLEA